MLKHAALLALLGLAQLAASAEIYDGAYDFFADMRPDGGTAAKHPIAPVTKHNTIETAPEYLACLKNARYCTSLVLEGRLLVGEIPSDIGKLTALTEL
jgi:hypothetical protein